MIDIFDLDLLRTLHGTDPLRQAPSIAAINTVFISQSPEWITATCQGVPSHITAPTHISAENPSQIHRAKITELATSFAPTITSRCAMTKVMPRVRRISISGFQSENVMAAAAGSTARQIPPTSGGL